jgi:hypothetical protein
MPEEGVGRRLYGRYKVTAEEVLAQGRGVEHILNAVLFSPLVGTEAEKVAVVGQLFLS